MSTRAHVLYRHYDADSVLLYVGITNDPGKRWAQHGRDKNWWNDVAVTRIEHFDSREAVLDAEKKAIADERPRWNIAGNAEGIAYRQRLEKAASWLMHDWYEHGAGIALIAGLMPSCREAFVWARDLYLDDWVFDGELPPVGWTPECRKLPYTAMAALPIGWLAPNDLIDARYPVSSPELSWAEQGVAAAELLVEYAEEHEVEIADLRRARCFTLGQVGG